MIGSTIVAIVAMSLSAQAAEIKNYCGSYASVIKTGSTYEIFSNASNNSKAKCPGSGCPGITRYYGSLSNPNYFGVVAPNSIITDVFSENGTLSPLRMFTRPIIKRDGLGYVAIASVMNGYPAIDNQAIPAMLSSPDGLNWTYHGKLKGEPEIYHIFASGMALIVSETPPRYRFYTDGYGVNMAMVYSDDGSYWRLLRNPDNSVKELKPPQWKNSIFHSMVEMNGIYYLGASENWPVTRWQFAHSLDGETWVHDRFVAASPYRKNVSLYIDNGNIMNLGTASLKGSDCFRKTIMAY